jgi:hypothetical protein
VPYIHSAWGVRERVGSGQREVTSWQSISCSFVIGGVQQRVEQGGGQERGGLTIDSRSRFASVATDFNIALVHASCFRAFALHPTLRLGVVVQISELHFGGRRRGDGRVIRQLFARVQ